MHEAQTSTVISSHLPEPSVKGQPVLAQYEVSVDAPGSGAPTGTVTVSDGVNSCTGTPAAGQCTITLTSLGTRTLTASYSGDANFTGSVSPPVTHSVQGSAAAPRVTGVAPNAGPVTGGTHLTITGTGFVAGASVTVYIGQKYLFIPAKDVNVVSSTELTCVTFGGAERGTWHLVVRTIGGFSPRTSADLFTYYRLFVGHLSPDHGPVSGGTEITITGTGFAPNSVVKFGQGHGAGAGSLVATDVRVLSLTTITCKSPKHAMGGSWNVYVNIPGHGSSPPHPADEFTYDKVRRHH